MSSNDSRAALAMCLDVLLRSVPGYYAAAGVEQCTDEEHDAAIASAAAVCYGPSRDTWPPLVRQAAEGGF